MDLMELEHHPLVKEGQREENGAIEVVVTAWIAVEDGVPVTVAATPVLVDSVTMVLMELVHHPLVKEGQREENGAIEVAVTAWIAVEGGVPVAVAATPALVDFATMDLMELVHHPLVKEDQREGNGAIEVAVTAWIAVEDGVLDHGTNIN